MKNKKTVNILLFCLGILTFLLVGCDNSKIQSNLDKPNIIFILADDLGYGDISCYNNQSKIKTPNIDRLAQEGMKFNDAHSPSTVCTPSRYGFMTGRMPFRLNYKGVFTGAGGPCLITDERITIAEMLKNQGYETALFGKWHVGLTFYDSLGNPINKNGLDAVKKIDFARKIKGGPIHQGFDHFFGTASCPTTDWLYAYIEHDSVPVPPYGIVDKTNLPKHPYSKDNRSGMIAENFDLQKVDEVFLQKSISFLESKANNPSNQPFFLFHSTQAVHLPSFANPDYQNKSGAGPHGDFIHQLDDHVGILMETLKKNNLDRNTLIIMSSDNGPEVPTTIAMRRDHFHDGARPWRGVKRDNWEGGHRVPFIAWWPGKINPGLESDQTICLTDLMSTFADILHIELPDDAAEDSYSILPALVSGSYDKPLRPFTLHQTMRLGLAIRSGSWKYLDHKGSSGNNYENGGEWGMKQFALPESAPEAPGQLYDLETDPGETTNLYDIYPEKVNELKKVLDETKRSGRSAPLNQ
jgi:arylsulfatase A-like enzyme